MLCLRFLVLSLAETVGVRAAGWASQGGSEGATPPGSSSQQQSFGRVGLILVPCACVAGADLVAGGVTGEDPEAETGAYGLSNQMQIRARAIN